MSEALTAPNAGTVHPMAESHDRFRASLAALEAVKTVNPDRYAKARQQGRLLNLPAHALYTEKDDEQAPPLDENGALYRLLKLAQEGNGYAKAHLERYGRTLAALANPDHAAVSQDDQHSFTRMEDALRQADFNQLSLGEKLANAWNAGWWQLRQASDVQLLKNQAQRGGLLEQYQAIDRELAEYQAQGKIWDNPNKYMFGFEYERADEAQRAHMREEAAKGDKEAFESTKERLIQRQNDLDALPVDPVYIRMERLKAAGLGDVASTWQAVAEQPAFIPRLTAGALPASLEILGAAAVGGALAGPVGSVGMMAATEYPIEHESRFIEVLQRRGVNLGNPAELLKAFQDDALMADAEREAQLKATGTTAVDVGLAVIAGRLLAPLKVFGRTLSRGQREAANLIAQMPIQGLGEGASEAAGEYLASGQVKWDNALLEALAGAGFSALDVGVFSQQRLSGYLKDARQAKQAAGALDEMVLAARDSKTLNRDPQAFREMVEKQLAGSPLESLYLPASALTELNQSGELAPLLERVDGLAERYREAEAAGGELHLSTADYLVAFGEQHERLKDKVRVTRQSTQDTIQFTEDYAQNLHDLQDVLGQSDAAPLEQSRQQLIGELLQAGFNRTEATHYASLHTAFLQQLEERTGLALADLQRRFDLSIRRSVPEQVKAISDLSLALNRLRKGDIPSPQAIFGDTLLQALHKAGGLTDNGGELAARDVDKGKVGKHRLVRPGGMVIGHATEWAQQEGYIDTIDERLLFEALDRELQGQPVYSAYNHNAELNRIRDELDALQQAVTESGLDLNTHTDEEIIKALTGAPQTNETNESANIQELLQSALDNLTVAELDNLPALADKKAIEAAFKAFGIVENKNDGRRVGFPASTAGKIKGHRGFDARQIAAAFDQLFEAAVPMFSEMEQPKPGHKDHTSNIEAYHHYLSAFRQKGETHYVRFTVQQMRAGRKAKKGTEGESLLHSAFISAVSIYDKSAVSASPASLWDSTQSLQGSLGSAALSDTKLAQWLASAKSELQQGGLTQERDLVATHNLSEAALLHAKKMGGLAAPSFAVTKKDSPLENFGEITLIGDRDFAAPERGKHVFAADIYSPQYPTTETEIDPKAYRAFVDWLTPLAKKLNEKIPSLSDLQERGAELLIKNAALMQEFADANALKRPYSGNPPLLLLLRDLLKEQLQEHGLWDAFKQYARQRLEHLSLGERIFSGYSKAGNRRYIQHTLENVVKLMRTNRVRGSSGVAGNMGRLRAHHAPQFASIQAMRKAKERLVSAEQFEAVSKEIETELEKLANAVAPRLDYPAFMQFLEDIATKGIQRSSQDNGIPLDSVKQREVETFLAKLRDLPTEYFEGKFARAVGIGEFKAAVVPETIGKEALDYLKEQGISDIRFYDPNVKGARAKAIQQAEHLFFQGGAKSPRGSIRFEAGVEAGQPRQFEIRLEATRDLSTLLHELGHFYLEVVQDVVASGHANSELSADLRTIRGWLGVEEGAALSVEQHEQFARGFEAYLAEGRAPSNELVPAFARFKRWLIGVYKQLTRLNVTLNDEIRGVFNRLLASEQQVLEAQNQSAALALFENAEQAGMTESDFAAYKDSLERAHAEASEQVQREIAQEASLERKKWWKGEADKIREEVAEEVDAQPVYAALKRLRAGEFKLGTDELIRRYGASNIKKLAFLHQKDGRPAEVLAPLLGFDSGDALVKALLAAQPRRELIEQETAQRMLERFGVQMDSEAAEKALAAVHGAARENVLTLELLALGKQTAHKAGTSAAALKQAAKTLMQQRLVKSIQPETFRRSEAKAGREAFNAVLKGDLESAYLAKQRQLLNFYLWREAASAKKQIDAGLKRLQAFRKDSRRAQLGKSSKETLDLIDTLLYQFALSARAPEESASIVDWYQRQLQAGTEPYLPSFLLSTRERQSVRELTFSQFTELDEFAQHLWHGAKLQNQLIAQQVKQDFFEARDALINGGYAHLKARPKPPIDPSQLTTWEKLKNTGAGLVSSLLKMEQIVSWLDGDKINGAWSQLFWQPFVEAQNEASRLQTELTSKLVERLERYQQEAGKGRLREAVFVESIGQSLSYNALLALALNSGNESNKTKLLKGYGWDDSQLAGALAHLNQADWQLVQDLWDLVGSLWPAIEQLQRDLTGLPPDAVKAMPIETPFGSFTGGYWPLVYDKSSAAYARVQESSPTELFESGYIRATTPKGHTKTRNEGFAAPILLSLEVVAPHLAQVVHDLTHRKAVRDGAKILSDPAIKQMLIDTLGSPTADQFMHWVKGIANSGALAHTQEIHAWQRLSERLRMNLPIAYMGFSATTSITQLLGYSQSLEYFAKQGGRRYLYQGVLQFLRHPIESATMIKELSGEMRYRSDHLDRDINAALRKNLGKTGVLSVVQRLAFKPIAFIQSLVDYPTWLAAFNQAQHQGLSQDLSIQAADRAVRLTQMAAGTKDLAAVQRDTGLMRWFTIVYSYQSLLFNRLVDLSQSDISGTKNKLLWLERFTYLVAVAAILAPLLQGRGPDDDEDWEEWAALKIATYPLSSVPVLRDAEGLISNGWAMRGTTPLSDVGNALARFIGTDDEHKRLNAAIEAAGYGLGLPVAQPKRTAGYLWERLEGEHQDDDFKDFMRGLLFGPAKKD